MSANLHGGFVESARRFPERPALAVDGQSLTYAELDRVARRWAGALEGRRVGIFADRTMVAYVGILAALMSGATFVPLNPAFPIARTASMIRRAKLDALVVDARAAQQLRDVVAQLPEPPRLVLLPTLSPIDLPGACVLGAAELAGRTPIERAAEVPADAIAYLLFTSGSTGEPKGVPVTHANVTSFLRTNQRRYEIRPEDRLSQTFDLTFDLSMFDMFMAWGAGACVCVCPPAQLLSPAKWIDQQKITVWFSVPAVGALLKNNGLLKPGSLPSLRLSLFCGEALSVDVARAWQRAASSSRLENLYGPTELTIACAAYPWDDEVGAAEAENGIVPIGRVYEGLSMLVVDEDLAIVPDGEVGELCVAGPQTFPGYLEDPQRTAERTFVRDGNTYYRTGDRVRLLPSGNLAYVGRVDQQVKVNGYRVELGEVEAALRDVPEVTAAVAIGWPVDDGGVRGVVAFVAGRATAQECLGAARERLPRYMLPRKIHVLDALPRNGNGKLDRKELARRLAAGEVS
jgi:amino acid adenylation domain-containing protein